MANNSQIALTFTKIGEDGLSETDLFKIVDYLSDNDDCSALNVYGVNEEGKKIVLNFGKTQLILKTKIELRNKFVNEKIAKDILLDVLNHSVQSIIPDF